MAKVTSKTGIDSQVFLGTAVPTMRGAERAHKAIIDACSSRITNGEVDETAIRMARGIFRHASSFVTDGASVNIGEQNGLWALFNRYFGVESLDEKRPVQCMKIWCAARRSQLAWKAVTTSVKEVSHIIQKITKISTYVHTSGLRSREFRETAKKENCSEIVWPFMDPT